MTDLPRKSSPPSGPMRHEILATGESGGRVRARVHSRRMHCLRGVLALAAVTLGAFSVLFALMIARLKAGNDPALRRGTSTALRAPSGAYPEDARQRWTGTECRRGVGRCLIPVTRGSARSRHTHERHRSRRWGQR